MIPRGPWWESIFLGGLMLLAVVTVLLTSCATIEADNHYVSVETCVYWER